MFYETIKKALRILSVLALPMVFIGCSVNLLQGDLENVPLTEEKYSFFGKMPLIYGGDSLEISQDLLKAYTAAASPETYPRNSCRGSASIVAEVTQESPRSSWTLGAVIVPFWPILPVDETLNFALTARIFCNGELVRRIEFSEEERIQATVYGRLRSDLINKAAQRMHRKLVERLRFELEESRQTDMNAVLSYNANP